MSVWVPPKTWKTGEDLTSADVNTYLVGNQSFLYAKPSVKANMSTPISVTTTTPGLLGFADADSWDTASLHDPTTDNSRVVTVPSGLQGHWSFTLITTWSSNSSGYRYIGCYVNKTLASLLYQCNATNGG